MGAGLSPRLIVTSSRPGLGDLLQTTRWTRPTPIGSRQSTGAPWSSQCTWQDRNGVRDCSHHGRRSARTPERDRGDRDAGEAEHPRETIAARSPASEATAPASRRRAAARSSSSPARSREPAAQAIRDRLVRDRPAEDAPDHVREARHDEPKRARARARARPETTIPHSPPAAAMHPQRRGGGRGRPAARHRREHRARGGRRVEQPEHARAAEVGGGAGKSAIGMPKNIATMSTLYVPRSSWRAPRVADPLADPRAGSAAPRRAAAARPASSAAWRARRRRWRRPLRTSPTRRPSRGGPRRRRAGRPSRDRDPNARAPSRPSLVALDEPRLERVEPRPLQRVQRGQQRRTREEDPQLRAGTSALPMSTTDLAAHPIPGELRIIRRRSMHPRACRLRARAEQR